MKCCICFDHEGTLYQLHEKYEHYAHMGCLSQWLKLSSTIDNMCPLCTLPVVLVSLPGMLRQAVETKTIEEFKVFLNASKHSGQDRIMALICAFNSGQHAKVHALLRSGEIPKDLLVKRFRCPEHESPTAYSVLFDLIAADAASPLDLMLTVYMLKRDREGTMLLLEEGARDTRAFCKTMACMLGWEDCAVQLISRNTYSANELFKAAQVAISKDNVQILQSICKLGVFDEKGLLTFCEEGKRAPNCYGYLSRAETINFDIDFLAELMRTLKTKGPNSRKDPKVKHPS